MTFNLVRYTEQLAALVAQPSISSAIPEWDMGNQAVLDLLAQWLTERAFQVEILPLPGQPGKANLLATRGSGPGGLVLAGHSDTVPYDENRSEERRVGKECRGQGGW